MNILSCALAVALTTGLHPQDDLDTELEKLSGKLSSEGVSGRLAAALKTDAGRLAVKERIVALTARVTDRTDRDPIAYYERWLFTEDADGNLKLRPERRVDLDRLVREDARRNRAFEDFDRRAKEVAGKIVETREIDKRAKAYWSDPRFRLALFQLLAPEQRDADPELLFFREIGRALHRGSDGKLRLRGSYVDEALNVIGGVRGEADGLAVYEEDLARLLETLDADERKRASSPPVRALLLRRVAEFAAEGVEDPFAEVARQHVSNRKLAGRELLEEIALVEDLYRELRPYFDRVASEMSAAAENDRQLKRILKEEVASGLLVRTLTENLATRRANRDGAVEAFREDHFTADDAGRLSVRDERFADDTLAAEYDGYLAAYEALRAAFLEVAERALDPSVVDLYETRVGASALSEHLQEVIGVMKEEALDASVRRFVKHTFMEDRGKLVVRPERVRRVEEILQHAEEIQKKLDQAGKEKP